jgi:hypothetical protein
VRALVKTLGVDVYDALTLVGFIALEYGVSQWSVPGAWVLAGVGSIGLGVWPAVRKRTR